jgi:hypothetical protein
MAMTPDSDGRFLPCGRDSTEVWDDAAADRFDPHELSCPYCQAVAAECHRLATAVAAWRSEPVEPPPTLVERVMVIVRAELRRRTALALPARHGPASLDAAAAAAALRFGADHVPAARVRSCQVRPRPPQPDVPPATSRVTAPAAGLPVPGGGTAPPTGEVGARTVVDIEATMVVAVGRPIADNGPITAVADLVREVMVAVATEVLGLTVGRMDLTVVDLIERPVGMDQKE